MEPLIKLRLLASQLEIHESQQLIQTIGFNKIISLLFNNFLLTFNKTQQHHNELSNITNIISDIINSRNKNKSTSFPEISATPLQIDELPLSMIGQCASYLHINDYMNFSLCNRNIYCAVNSPNKLQKLDISEYDNYNMITLNRFSMIKTLRIRPKIFNKLQIQIGQFPYLQKLELVNDIVADDDTNEDDISAFINSKIINLSQITHLELEEFGKHTVYQFDSFCDLLIQFPNVTHLGLSNIYLTEYEDDNDKIMKITPKLQTLHWMDLDDDPTDANVLLRNKLLNMYATQILQLHIDCKWDIGVYSFPKLNYLWTGTANESNDNWINIFSSTRCMKIIEMGCDSCKKSTMIQNSLIKSLKSTPNISVLRFLCCNPNEIQFIASTIEKMLLNSKEVMRKSLKIRITLHTDVRYDKIEMSDIELYLIRIMNLLDSSQIENKMLIFNFSKHLDTNKYRYKIIERFTSTHLTVTQDRTGNTTQYTMIISSKNCKINGYKSWL